MVAKTQTSFEREGTWEELIRDPAAFAGKRVRVTVLPDRPAGDAVITQSIRQWLNVGDRLEITPDTSKTSPFTDLLVEQARKQGLVI